MWASFFGSVFTGIVNSNANSNGGVVAGVDDDGLCEVDSFGGVHCGDGEGK